MQIGYIPFNSPRLLLDVEVLMGVHFVKKFGSNMPISVMKIHGCDPTLLAGIKTTQQLYVFCHSSSKPGCVGDGEQKTLGVMELAEQIEAEGLKKTHRELKLWVHSGLGDLHDSLAYKLWRALYSLGYKELEVYGYRPHFHMFAAHPLYSTKTSRFKASELPGTAKVKRFFRGFLPES